MARTSSTHGPAGTDDQPEQEAHETPGRAWGRPPSRELIGVGMEPATAIGILAMESAFSLSLAMLNAVNEQSSQWAINPSITIAGANLLLDSDILDEAVDSLLGRGRRRAEPAA